MPSDCGVAESLADVAALATGLKMPKMAVASASITTLIKRRTFSPWLLFPAAPQRGPRSRDETGPPANRSKADRAAHAC